MSYTCLGTQTIFREQYWPEHIKIINKNSEEKEPHFRWFRFDSVHTSSSLDFRGERPWKPLVCPEATEAWVQLHHRFPWLSEPKSVQVWTWNKNSFYAKCTVLGARNEFKEPVSVFNDFLLCHACGGSSIDSVELCLFELLFICWSISVYLTEKIPIS